MKKGSRREGRSLRELGHRPRDQTLHTKMETFFVEGALAAWSMIVKISGHGWQLKREREGERERGRERVIFFIAKVARNKNLFIRA